MISLTKNLLTFLYHHLFHLAPILSILHPLGRSFLCPRRLSELGKAGAAFEPQWSHCWCLGILPKNVPKHRYCLGFFFSANRICCHSACRASNSLESTYRECWLLFAVCTSWKSITALFLEQKLQGVVSGWTLSSTGITTNIKMSYCSSVKGFDFGHFSLVPSELQV